MTTAKNKTASDSNASLKTIDIPDSDSKIA